MKEGERRPSGRCLVLNADGTPAHICSVQRALYLLLDNNAFLVEAGHPPLRSPSTTMERPLVVQLLKYRSIPRVNRSIPVTNRAVLARDGHRCAYERPGICEGDATTIDHIKPRSAGGPHSWENVVASCRRCNQKKGSRSLEELGWELKFQPSRPRGPHARMLLHATEPAWLPYIYGAAA